MIYRWIKKFKSKGAVLKLSARSEKVTTGSYLSVRVPGNVKCCPYIAWPQAAFQSAYIVMVAVLNIFLNERK